MKKAIILMVVLCSVFNGFAFASGNSEGSNNNTTDDLPRIVILNNTGYEVVQIKLRRSGNAEWTSYEGERVLRNGNRASIPLPYPLSEPNRPPTDYYDIQLVDTDGDTYTKNLVLIHENGQTIEFIFDDIMTEETYSLQALPGYN